MHILFHRGSVIAILPKSTLPILSLIVFLARPSGYQLHRLWNNLSLPPVPDKKVNMVRSNRIIQDKGPKTLLGLKKPA
jgi:hypothetical protein